MIPAVKRDLPKSVWCRACGKPMHLMDEGLQRWYCYKDDEMYLAKEDKWTETPSPLTSEQKERLIKDYDVVYVDGYEVAKTAFGSICLLDNSVVLSFGRKVEASYDSIEVLNVSLEREITALRTWLAGPVIAAFAKKETRALTIGFRDKLGLLQLPSFKMAKSDIDDCYATIIERIGDKKSKHTTSQNLVNANRVISRGCFTTRFSKLQLAGLQSD